MKKIDFLLLGSMTYKQECFTKYHSFLFLIFSDEEVLLILPTWKILGNGESYRIGNAQFLRLEIQGNFMNHPEDKSAFTNYLPIN
jgi:hypothetical protein